MTVTTFPMNRRSAVTVSQRVLRRNIRLFCNISKKIMFVYGWLMANFEEFGVFVSFNVAQVR